MKTINTEKRNTGNAAFNIVFNALMAVILLIFLVSAAVFLVLALKPLYYWFIDLFKIEAYSGYSAAELKANYDALIDYNMFWGPKELVFPDRGMVTTEETMAHFVDVKQVFVFFQYLAIGSAVLLIPGCVVAKKKNISMWPKITLALTVAIIVGVGVGLVFFWDKFFIKFHEILFPGKSNWYINANYDKVILILPSEVFLADAAAILAVIALGIVLFVLFFRRKKSKAGGEDAGKENAETKVEGKKGFGRGRKARRESKKVSGEGEEAGSEEEREEAGRKEAVGEEDTGEEEIVTKPEETVPQTAEETVKAAEEAIEETEKAAEETGEEIEEETVEETRKAAEEAVEKAAEASSQTVGAMEETVEETREAAGEKAREAEKKAAEGSTAESFDEMDEDIAKTVEAFAESFEEFNL